MLKYILAVFLLCLTSVALANVVLKNSHYCCEVDTHTTTIETRTRVVSQVQIITSSHQHNYTYCPPTDHAGIIDHIASQLQSNNQNLHLFSLCQHFITNKIDFAFFNRPN